MVVPVCPPVTLILPAGDGALSGPLPSAAAAELLLLGGVPNLFGVPNLLAGVGVAPPTRRFLFSSSSFVKLLDRLGVERIERGDDINAALS